VKIQNYSEDMLNIRIENVDPNNRYRYEGVENNINKEIYKCYDLILRHSQYLINFHSVIPVDLLRILTKLKAPEIMLNMSNIENTNKDNFMAYRDDFIKLYNLFQELALYKGVFIDKKSCT